MESSEGSTSDHIVSIKYGFESRGTYIHATNHCNIISITFNSKTNQYIILDSRGISSWFKDSTSNYSTRLHDFVSYKFNFLLDIIYCRSMNVYFGLTNDYGIIVYNLNFFEIFSIATEGTTISNLVFDSKLNELITISRNKFQFWKFKIVEKSRACEGLKLQRQYYVPDSCLVTNAEYDHNAQRLYLLCDHDIWCYDVYGHCIVHFAHSRFLLSTMSVCTFLKEANTFITGTSVGEIPIYSSNGGLLTTLLKHTRVVTSLLAHPSDSSLFISSSMDGTIKVFSLQMFEELYSVNVFPEGVDCMKLRSSSLLYCASSSTVRLFDLNHICSFWSTVRCHVRSINVFPKRENKSSHIIVDGMDKCIRIYSKATGQKRCTVLPPPEQFTMKNVLSFSYDRTGNVIYILFSEMQLWIYLTRTDPATRVAVWNIQDILKTNMSRLPVVFQGDSEEMTNANKEFGVGSFNQKQQNEKARCVCTETISRDLYVDQLQSKNSLNFNLLMCGMSNGTVNFLDPSPPVSIILGFKAHPTSPVLELRTLYDDKDTRILTLIHTINNLSMRIWNARDFKQLNTIRIGKGMSVYSVKSSIFVSGNSEGHLRVVTLKENSYDDTNEKDPTSNDHYGCIVSVDILCQKGFICSCGTDQYIRLWNLHKDLLTELCFDETLCYSSFWGSKGSLLMGFKSQLFLIPSGILKLPNMERVDESSDSGNESQVYEDPQVRKDNAKHLEFQTKNLENYLIPYPYLFLESNWMYQKPISDDFEETDDKDIDKEMSRTSSLESDVYAPTEIYADTSCSSNVSLDMEMPQCCESPESPKLLDVDINDCLHDQGEDDYTSLISKHSEFMDELQSARKLHGCDELMEKEINEFKMAKKTLSVKPPLVVKPALVVKKYIEKPEVVKKRRIIKKQKKGKDKKKEKTKNTKKTKMKTKAKLKVKNKESPNSLLPYNNSTDKVVDVERSKPVASTTFLQGQTIENGAAAADALLGVHHDHLKETPSIIISGTEPLVDINVSSVKFVDKNVSLERFVDAEVISVGEVSDTRNLNQSVSTNDSYLSFKEVASHSNVMKHDTPLTDKKSSAYSRLPIMKSSNRSVSSSYRDVFRSMVCEKESSRNSTQINYSRESVIADLSNNSPERSNDLVSHSSFYIDPDNLVSHSSFYRDPNDLVSHSSFNRDPDNLVSHSSFNKDPDNLVSHSSFYKDPDDLVSHSSFYSSFYKDPDDLVSHSSFYKDPDDLVSHSSFYKDPDDLVSHSRFNRDPDDLVTTSPFDVTSKEFSRAKKVCFGSTYNISTSETSSDANIDNSQARKKTLKSGKEYLAKPHTNKKCDSRIAVMLLNRVKRRSEQFNSRDDFIRNNEDIDHSISRVSQVNDSNTNILDKKNQDSVNKTMGENGGNIAVDYIFEGTVCPMTKQQFSISQHPTVDVTKPRSYDNHWEVLQKNNILKLMNALRKSSVTNDSNKEVSLCKAVENIPHVNEKNKYSSDTSKRKSHKTNDPEEIVNREPITEDIDQDLSSLSVSISDSHLPFANIQMENDNSGSSQEDLISPALLTNYYSRIHGDSVSPALTNYYSRIHEDSVSPALTNNLTKIREDSVSPLSLKNYRSKIWEGESPDGRNTNSNKLHENSAQKNVLQNIRSCQQKTGRLSSGYGTHSPCSDIVHESYNEKRSSDTSGKSRHKRRLSIKNPPLHSGKPVLQYFPDTNQLEAYSHMYSCNEHANIASKASNRKKTLQKIDRKEMTTKLEHKMSGQAYRFHRERNSTEQANDPVSPYLQFFNCFSNHG